MDDVDFYVDAVVRHAVLGMRLGDAPMRSEQVLGMDFVDDISKGRGSMRRDFGLVEFAYEDPDDWKVSWVFIQVHRIASAGGHVVPPVLHERYGPLAARVNIEILLARVGGLGIVVREPVEDPVGGGYVRTTVVDRDIATTLIALAPGETFHSLREGDLWAISWGQPFRPR